MKESIKQSLRDFNAKRQAVLDAAEARHKKLLSAGYKYDLSIARAERVLNRKYEPAEQKQPSRYAIKCESMYVHYAPVSKTYFCRSPRWKLYMSGFDTEQEAYEYAIMFIKEKKDEQK